MPRTISQSLKLYEKNVSGNTLTLALDPNEAARLEHSTKLPGGFFETRVTLPTTEREFWDWRHNRMLSRLVIEEPGGGVVWEGRIEEVALADLWRVDLTAFGYWSNLTDSVLNRDYTSGSDTGGSIISDLLRNIHSDTRQVSTSDAHISTGPAIVQRYQDDWTVWRILTDYGRGVASFGSGSGVKMDIGVWERRELHYSQRSPRRIDWYSFVRPENGGGVVTLPLRVAWQDVANAVVVTYTHSGAVSRTSEAVDRRSISRHIRRERHISNIGESVSTTANSRRDTELALRKDLQQRTNGLVIDRVWDVDGTEWPLCRVRAGDVIRLPDFTPSTGDLAGTNLDAFRTFFVEETRCDHTDGTLTIRPDREGTSLIEILERNDIR